MMILLIARLCTHMRHVTSFFGVKSAGTTHELTFLDESFVK